MLWASQVAAFVADRPLAGYRAEAVEVRHILARGGEAAAHRMLAAYLGSSTTFSNAMAMSTVAGTLPCSKAVDLEASAEEKLRQQIQSATTALEQPFAPLGSFPALFSEAGPSFPSALWA